MTDTLKIVLESNSTIVQAEAFAAQLEEVFRRSRPVEFDGGVVERVDTAILQLLLTFFREMRLAGVKVGWKASSENLKKSANLLGVAKELDL